MIASKMDQFLPGTPSRRLVKSVRFQLRSYGIQPQREHWHDAWRWASALSYNYIRPGKIGRRARPIWPTAYEIASLYVYFLLAAMRRMLGRRLPYGAFKHLPPELAARGIAEPAKPLELEAGL